MRAIVFEGKKIKYRADYPPPRPSKGEALVRISLAGVCATDMEITKGYMGFKGVPGHEFVGVVEKCADKGFIGRRVAGEINIGCGACRYCMGNIENHCPKRKVLGILGKDGAFAEYLTLPAKNLHVIPGSVSDEEAVFVEPLAAAFEMIEQVKITPDKKVCVLGDGRLGLLVAMVLSLTGCSLVAVGRHREKLNILKRMGIKTALGSKGLKMGFDIVVDCTGSQEGFDAALKIARPRGVVILKTTVAKRGPIDLNRVVIDEITVIGSRCGPFEPAIKALKEKTIDVKPLISEVFPLKQGVEAIEYAKRRGVLKVMIKM